MKSIKKNKKFILGILIGIIIGCFGTSYAAYLYKSSDVLYTKSNGTETSVQSALNELYNKRISLSTSNSSNYITWASDKKSLTLNGDNYYKGTINTTEAYNAGYNSMTHHGAYTDANSYARSNGKTFIRIPKGAYLTSGYSGLNLPEIVVNENLYSQSEYNNNYQSGYNQGKNDYIKGGVWALASWNNSHTAATNSHSSPTWAITDSATLPAGTYAYFLYQKSPYGNNGAGWIKVNGTTIASLSSKDEYGNCIQGRYTLNSASTVEIYVGNYNGGASGAFVRVG